MDSNTYIVESEKFLSKTEEEARKVSTHILMKITADGLNAGLFADAFKRQLFYVDKNVKHRVEKDMATLQDMITKLAVNGKTEIDLTENQINALHAILGIMSETKEMIEEFINAVLEGREFNPKNTREEAGDQLWYLALYLRSIGSNFEECMDLNIAKLDKRYKDKQFSTEQALNRDIDAEQAVFDQKTS